MFSHKLQEFLGTEGVNWKVSKSIGGTPKITQVIGDHDLVLKPHGEIQQILKPPKATRFQGTSEV